MMNNKGKKSVYTAFVLFMLCHPPAWAGFVYAPITDPILSASFSADFASLAAHRTIGGVEVNSVRLLGLGGDEVDLSDQFFGTCDLLLGPPTCMPAINQGALETGVVSALIPNSFFSELLSGRVGVSFLATDTQDGLFALDFLSLNIETSAGTVESFIDDNDGFGLGLADGASLPGPLPTSIPFGATGTGFDESVSSKSHVQIPMPEPGTVSLFVLGIFLSLLHKLPLSPLRKRRTHELTHEV